MKNGEKRLKKALLALLLAAALLVLPSCNQSDVVAGNNERTDILKMPSDGVLRVAVFADVQDTQSVSTDLIQCMEKILDEQKPDLVVFLGDQAEGHNPWIHIGNNEKNIKSLISKVLAPVTERKIDFCVVFGNHDSLDSGVAKETQMAYYMSFPGCLAYDEGESLPGCGTYDLVYADDDGNPVLHLYFVDSGEYAAEGGYASVSDAQSEWCAMRARELKELNGGNAVPAFLFQHIIVPEIYDVLGVDETGSGIKGNGVYSDRYWTEPSDGSFAGILNEAPCPPASSTQFSYWKEEGDIAAAFFGHDHVNSFVARYEDIDLVACPGMTYASYNDSAVRGARIIDIYADGTYDSEVLSLGDYEEKGFIADVRRALENPWVTLGICAVLVLAALITAVAVPVAHARRKAKEKKKVAVEV